VIRDSGRWQMSPRLGRRATAYVPVPSLPYCQSKNGSRRFDFEEEQVRRRQSIVGNRLERFIPSDDG
jgi:hypothetical protein